MNHPLLDLFDAAYLDSEPDRRMLADALEEAGLHALADELRDGDWDDPANSGALLRHCLGLDLGLWSDNGLHRPLLVPCADCVVLIDKPVGLGHRRLILNRPKVQPSPARFWIPLTYAPSAFVNVAVTGRTWQRYGGRQCVRVQVEFVHDHKPSTFAGGYMHD